jgi:cytochrome c556
VATHTRKVIVAGLAALLSTTALRSEAKAQDTAPVVEYRQNAMRMVAGHQNAIEALLEQSVAPDSHIVPHARALLDLSIMMPDLFPVGSGGANTRALDAIWRDSAGFAAAVAEFRTAAEDLLAAAETGNRERVREGLGALSAGCGTCHQPFRKPAPPPSGAP